jgi:hypothetical protein
LNGNIWEWTPGLRIVDGEIQVIQNNDAALASTDHSATSTAWRAISAADGSLVAPGTAGTLKYDCDTEGSPATDQRVGNVLLSDVVSHMNGPAGDTGFYGQATSALETTAAKAGLTVPAIAKALGLYSPGAGLKGDTLYVRNYGERLAIRGGYWNSGAYAGVFALGLSTPRSNVSSSFGSRPAFVL